MRPPRRRAPCRRPTARRASPRSGPADARPRARAAPAPAQPARPAGRRAARRRLRPPTPGAATGRAASRASATTVVLRAQRVERGQRLVGVREGLPKARGAVQQLEPVGARAAGRAAASATERRASAVGAQRGRHRGVGRTSSAARWPRPERHWPATARRRAGARPVPRYVRQRVRQQSRWRAAPSRRSPAACRAGDDAPSQRQVVAVLARLQLVVPGQHAQRRARASQHREAVLRGQQHRLQPARAARRRARRRAAALLRDWPLAGSMISMRVSSATAMLPSGNARVEARRARVGAHHVSVSACDRWTGRAQAAAAHRAA